ncbi:MAG: HAD-IA family hydrolase [Sutterellaceae bacterium]|nr:HAD-IA family hydrolase [Sutterellaceae bacterium]MDD7443088.1 HAD-IA family hydrolase [Sutterellaceae bacterium]MDY2868786.1 HAD-IA family hydrolase [Mesosutterella sp.]
MVLHFDAARVKGLLFDLDGTLVDSLPDLHYAVCGVLSDWGLPAMSMEEVGRYVGKGVIHLAEMVLKARKPEADEATRDRFVKGYVDALAASGSKRTRAIPGVAEALSLFSGAGLPLAVVTNKAGVLVDAVLQDTGLSGYFSRELCFSADDVEHPKPAPDMLFLAARRMGIDPADCLMFGDSRNDAEAASRAGMPVMLLETGYNEGDPIADWGRKNNFRDIFPSMDLAARALLSERNQLIP